MEAFITRHEFDTYVWPLAIMRLQIHPEWKLELAVQEAFTEYEAVRRKDYLSFGEPNIPMHVIVRLDRDEAFQRR